MMPLQQFPQSLSPSMWRMLVAGVFLWGFAFAPQTALAQYTDARPGYYVLNSGQSFMPFLGGNSTPNAPAWGSWLNSPTITGFYWYPFIQRPLAKDIRFCVQGAASGSASNPSGQGTGRCTPWTSQGGGWSLFTSDSDGADPAYLRMREEKRNWPASAAPIGHIQAGAQVMQGTCPTDANYPAYHSARYSQPLAVTGSNTAQADMPPAYVPPIASGISADCIRIFLLGATYPSTPAAGVPQVGIQAYRGDDNLAGAPAFTTNGWSAWVAAPGNADIDMARIFAGYTATLSNRLDMKFCIQVANVQTEAAAQNEKCTPWISEGSVSSSQTSPVDSSATHQRITGGGWVGSSGATLTLKEGYGISGWALPASGSDPNFLRIKVETRTMPNTFPYHVKVLGLSIRAADSRTCADTQGTMQWAASGILANQYLYLPWSPWANDSSGQSVSEPDCYRLQVGASLEDLLTPSVTLSTTKATIDLGQTTRIIWRSTAVSSCTGTGFSTGGATAYEPGLEITPTQTTTYGISCVPSQGGANVTHTMTITVNHPEPKANLIGTPNSANAVAGIGTQLSGSVYNGGDREARSTSQSGNFNNTFRVYDYQTGQTSTWSVATGPLERLASRTVYADYTFPAAGSYSFSFCADQNTSGQGSVTESNESDNCDSTSEPVELTVGEPAPAYLYLQASPFIIKRDATTVFDWTAQNVQPGSCYVNPTNISTYGVYGLNDNGETSGLRESNSIPARGNWVLYCTDLLGNGVESNSVEVRLLPGFSEF